VIRLEIPPHLRELSGLGVEVTLDVRGTPTLASVLDALETLHPELRGTIRDRVSGRRRDLLRFFASGKDLSFERMDAPLPESVQRGEEPLVIIGAIAGG